MNTKVLTWFLCRVAVMLLLACIIIFSSGCVTEKQRIKICRSCTLNQSVKDSVRIEFKDRPVKVYVHDTVQVQTPNPCAELCDQFGKLKQFDKTIQGKKGTRTRLFTRNDSLIVEAIADSLQAMARARDSMIIRMREVREQVLARCEKRHLTDADIFWGIWGRRLTWLISIYVLLRLLKVYLKNKLPLVAKFIP